MGKRRFNTERTQAGLQFVIPGTERPAEPPKRKYARDGSQLVIPGAEQVNTRTLLDRIASKPLRPRAGQSGPAGTPLFRGARSR